MKINKFYIVDAVYAIPHGTVASYATRFINIIKVQANEMKRRWQCIWIVYSSIINVVAINLSMSRAKGIVKYVSSIRNENRTAYFAPKLISRLFSPVSNGS